MVAHNLSIQGIFKDMQKPRHRRVNAKPKIKTKKQMSTDYYGSKSLSYQYKNEVS